MCRIRTCMRVGLGIVLLALGCGERRDDGDTATRAPAPASPTTAEAPDPPGKPAPAAPTPEAPSEPPHRVEPRADILVEEVGFAAPESVLHDTERDLYLVSNVGGSAVARDGDGFISRLEPDGGVVALKWIDGAADGVELNAPKGMAIANAILYVADIDVVRKFDAADGRPLGSIAVEGASFLNDVAAGPDGRVYVSDSGVTPGDDGFVATGTDAVYRLTDDGAEAIARGPELGWPNGLAVDERGVWVVTLGKNELYRIAEGKRVDVQALGRGGLDGLVKLPGGRFLVSSWDGEQIVQGVPGKPFELVLAKVRAPADVGYDAQRSRLLVPRFEDDAVHIVGL